MLGIYSLQTPSGSPGEGGGRAGVGRSVPPTFLLLTPKAHLMCDLVWREVVAVVSCVCPLLAEQASDVALLFKIPGQVGKGGGGGGWC